MFKVIEGENLFSWESLRYEIQAGISQITGFNYVDQTPEGSGKSSVPNILAWTLYGSIPKDAKIDEVVRDGCKSGHGRVTLEDDHKVYRSRKPNDLYIEKPNGEIVKGKDARETQLIINQLVGRDFEAFCQTVYFAQNYPNKFISAGESDKARILSEVQDLTVFDRARKRALEVGKAVDNTLLELDRQMTAVEAEESRLKSNAQLITEFVQKFENDKTAKLETLNQEKDSLLEKVGNLEVALEEVNADSIQAEFDQIDELLNGLSEQKGEHTSAIKAAESASAEKLRLKRNVESFEAKFQKLEIKVQRTEGRIKQAEGKLHKTEAKVFELESAATEPDNCPTCGQAASEAMLKKHKAHTKKQILDLISEIEACAKDIEEAQEELVGFETESEELKDEHEAAVKKYKAAKAAPTAEDAQKALKRIEKETQELLGIRRSIQATQTKVLRDEAELKSTYRSLERVTKGLEATESSDCLKELQKLEMIDSELLTQEAKRKTLQKQHSEATTRRRNLEILKTGFKEVKQYVFQSLLRELSVKSTSLAAELFEMPVKVEFSNDDAEDGGVSKIRTSVTLNGVPRSLGLLSGGQYSRVALAVNIALSDVVAQRGNKGHNLLILDEPFQNLSLSSMQKMIDLLEARGKSVILIEHNDLIKQIVSNVFNIELRDGISRAV